MKGLAYQLKNIRRDKLCMLSFLLPVLAGLAISLLSGVNFSSLSETVFYVMENDLPDESIEWLRTYGRVTVFADSASLKDAVNDPATQGIGVLKDDTGIRTLLSGDELKINKVTGNTLPQLYAERNNYASARVTITPITENRDALKSLLIVITMLTAMFMGCTFNAMNIIGEKEDGISFINGILPMTKTEYISQKIILGFTGGVISAILTAAICMRISVSQILPLLLMIILSTFVAALAGLFIGVLSNGLMTGIVCIKLIMILFLASPVLVYLTVPSDSFIHTLSYLLPSAATFYGLMDLLDGQTQELKTDIIVLSAHCILWLLVFSAMERRKPGKVFAK